MVMFKADEKKIKDQEKQEKEARRKSRPLWFRISKRIVLTVAVIIALVCTVLYTIGGTSPMLKEGLEQYLSSASGYKAEIDDFHHMTFFPDMAVSFENLTFYDPALGENVASVRSVDLSVPFWFVMSPFKTIQALSVEDINIVPELAKGQPLHIEYLGVQEEDDKSYLGFTGTYGEEKIYARLTLEKKKERSYKFASQSDLKAESDLFTLEGQLDRKKPEIALTLVHNENAVPPMSASITKGFSLLDDRWLINMHLGTTKLFADIASKGNGIEGKIEIPELQIDDGPSLLAPFYIASLLSPASTEPQPISLKGTEIELDINIASVKKGDIDLGNINIPLKIEDNILAIEPVKGTLSGGNLSGSIQLNAQKSPANLIIQSSLKNWQYGYVQQAFLNHENVTGEADIELNLESTATYDSDIPANLKGTIALIGGEGKMASGAFNIWGAGLVNALLPSLDPKSETKLNCMIAKFDVDKGIATANPLFLDTKRVTVTGEGNINLAASTIDMKIIPAAKQTALIDISSPVKIKGPLGKPSIGPDAAGLGKTIGSLVLGAINPATLAITMTDLGATESHPCHKYVGAGSE